MSAYGTLTLDVISPATTTMPVFTSVSHATRQLLSSAMIASRIASEIWSHILSGCPSDTDSEVNRKSLSGMRFLPGGCEPNFISIPVTRGQGETEAGDGGIRSVRRDGNPSSANGSAIDAPAPVHDPS